MDRNFGDWNYVGQRDAEIVIDNWKARDSFPHFILISGDAGSGRLSLSYIIAKELDARISVLPDVAADTIRNLVDIAYQLDDKIVYVIPNSDSMSVAAKNSLLKLTEEPPGNAYIIMILQSLENTLPTLVSRSQHILMEPYSYEDLRLLCNDNIDAIKISETPGMLKRVLSMGKEDQDRLITMCSNLVYYVDKITIGNALKSAINIKFKESDKGWDIDIFLAGVRYVLEIITNKDSISKEELLRISIWYSGLSYYLYKFKRSGVNRKAVYDQLLFYVRGRLQEEAL